MDLRHRWSPSAAKGAALVCLALASGLAAPARAGGPRYWDWPEGRSFAEVTLAGAGFDTLGGLTAGPAVTVQALSGPEVVWRVAADGRGGWYLGTGHGGEIHHVAADGKTRLVARLESTEVFSLVVLPGGDLLAGGGPDGRLSRVTAAGDVTEVGRIDGSYVWAMTLQEKAGVVWLATGAPAAVYRYRWREGKLEKVVTLPAQNTMDVAFDDRQRLLAVTQGPGLVYRVAGESGAVPLLIGEIAQDEARRLLRGPQGAFHVLGLSNGADALASGGGEESGGAATPSPSAAGGAKAAAPAVALYRLGVDGRGHEVLSRVWAGDRDLMTAVWSPRWGWLGAGTLGTGAAETGPGGADRPAAPGADRAESSAVVYRLTLPWGARPLTAWEGGDVLDLLAVDGGRATAEGASDVLAAAQAHPAALVLLGAGTADRFTAVSPPLDGGPGVTWGRLRWEGVEGEGAPRWSVRGGRRAQPDETWTSWSDTWTDRDHALPVENCQYLQWRVDLPRGESGRRAWRVTGVSVSATQANLPPVIEDFRLEQLRGIKLGGLNGGESIVHEYRSGLRAEFTTQDAPADGWAAPDRVDPGRAVRVVTWRASDPNGDRLEFRLECRRVGEADWRPAAAPGEKHEVLTGSLGSWDTSLLPDGRYELRLVASDRPDNPGAEGRSVRELGPLTVDNTPPELTGLESGLTDKGAGMFIRLRAQDAASPLAGARLVMPDGTAQRLDPRDGVCDSSAESFDATVPIRRASVPDSAGPLRVRVEVRDLAGNTAGLEAVVR